jgi:hypothetical protein
MGIGSNLTLPRQKFSGSSSALDRAAHQAAVATPPAQGSGLRPHARDDGPARTALIRMPRCPGPNSSSGISARHVSPNYFVEGHGDSWVGWEPRTINGVRQGRWASDGIEGGGLLLPDGLEVLAAHGPGELKYLVSEHRLCCAGQRGELRIHVRPEDLPVPELQAVSQGRGSRGRKSDRTAPCISRSGGCEATTSRSPCGGERERCPKVGEGERTNPAR